jgi:hypothetical protein
MSPAKTLSVALLIGGCADLRSLAPGVCGNGVREGEEDCDAYAEPALGASTRCAPPDDAARACRYECTIAGGAVCPAGWGCGGDGICRRASGRFAELATAVMPADELALGDVDGDGAIDVVGSAAGAIAIGFGDGHGGLVAALSRPAPLPGTRAPALGDVDGRAGADLVVPTPVGLVVLRSGAGAGRQLTSVAYASYSLGAYDETRLTPVDADGHGPGQSLFYLRQRAGSGTEAYVVPMPFSGSSSIAPSSDLPLFDMTELAGRPAVGQLDADASSEIVLARRGANEVVVLQTEAFESVLLPSATQSRVATEVRLRVPGAVDAAGALVVELDGDAQHDVLIALGGRVYALRGDGTAAFETRFDAMQEGARFPLAAGDLDGDGLADFVMGDGIYRATGPAPSDDLALVQRAATPWAEAVIASFNGDGHGDVAVSTSTGLELLLGFADGTFTSLERLARAQRPRFLRSGFFDGDTVADLLWVESVAEDEDEVWVVFGEASGVGERVSVGRLPALEQVELGRLQLSSVVPLDGASDVVATSRPRDGRRSLAFISGGTRQLFFPFVLQTGNVSYAPIAAFAGRFGAEEVNDIVAVTASDQAPDEARVWLLPGAKDADYRSDLCDEPTCSRSAASHALLAGALDARCAHYLAGRLDGGDHDVVVAIAPNGAPGCEAAGALVAVVWVDDSGQISHRHRALPEAGTAVNDAAIGDADGDGAPDLAVAWQEHVAIYWGPEHEDAASVVALGGATSLAFINADDSADAELAVLAADGVRIVEIAGRDLRAPGAPAIATGGKRLRAADLDGDGLDDLALGDGATVTLLGSLPVGETAP